MKKSDIGRIAAATYIEEHADGSAQRPYDKVAHLLGIAESGVDDLGLRHRKYLIKTISASSLNNKPHPRRKPPISP